MIVVYGSIFMFTWEIDVVYVFCELYDLFGEILLPTIIINRYTLNFHSELKTWLFGKSFPP